MVSERVDPPTTMTEDDAIAESYIRMQGTLRELIDQLRQMNARSAADFAEIRHVLATRDCRPKDERVTPDWSDELQVSSVKKQAEDLPRDKSYGSIVRYADVFDPLPVNEWSLPLCAPTEDVRGLRDNVMCECRKEGPDVDDDGQRKGEVVGVRSLSEEDEEAHDLRTRLGSIPTLVGMNIWDDDKSRINTLYGRFTIDISKDENKTIIVKSDADHERLDLIELFLDQKNKAQLKQGAPRAFYNLSIFPSNIVWIIGMDRSQLNIIIDPGGMLNIPIDSRSTPSPLDWAEEGGDAYMQMGDGIDDDDAKEANEEMVLNVQDIDAYWLPREISQKYKQQITPVFFIVENDKRLVCIEVYRGFSWVIHSNEFSANVSLLLGGDDKVLQAEGLIWQSKVNTIIPPTSNFKSNQMHASGQKSDIPKAYETVVDKLKRLKAHSSTRERVTAERFWWSLLDGVDWWDVVRCTQSTAEHKYGPSLDRIKCRLLECTNGQEVRAMVLDMQARLLLDMLEKGIESALINPSTLVSEPWQASSETFSNINPEAMAVEQALGPSIQNLTTKFSHNVRKHLLQGVTVVRRKEIVVHTLEKILQRFYISSTVFMRIRLKRGSQPVNIRPYRQSALPKDALESIIEEMLLAGTIQSSAYPYPPSVMLDGYPPPTQVPYTSGGPMFFGKGIVRNAPSLRTGFQADSCFSSYRSELQHGRSSQCSHFISQSSVSRSSVVSVNSSPSEIYSASLTNYSEETGAPWNLDPLPDIGLYSEKLEGQVCLVEGSGRDVASEGQSTSTDWKKWADDLIYVDDLEPDRAKIFADVDVTESKQRPPLVLQNQPSASGEHTCESNQLSAVSYGKSLVRRTAELHEILVNWEFAAEVKFPCGQGNLRKGELIRENQSDDGAK